MTDLVKKLQTVSGEIVDALFSLDGGSKPSGSWSSGDGSVPGAIHAILKSGGGLGQFTTSFESAEYSKHGDREKFTLKTLGTAMDAATKAPW